MTLQICLDASVILKLALPESDSQLASDLWRFIITTNRQAVAPQLFPFEITAVLRKSVYQGKITTEFGLNALKQLLSLDIRLLRMDDIHLRAWEVATQLNRPTTYDAHYLALAQELGCEFWTGDRRLYNAVHHQLSWVHWLGNFIPNG